MTIYETLKQANCKLDSHESDLYVEATPEAIKLTKDEPNMKFFVSQIDGKTWIELPFRFDPFWEKKPNLEGIR